MPLNWLTPSTGASA